MPSARLDGLIELEYTLSYLWVYLSLIKVDYKLPDYGQGKYKIT